MAVQKRLSAPKIVRMKRKHGKYITSASPGAHPRQMGVSLLYVARNMLKAAENSREARKLVSGGKILVDGRPCKSCNFPVGLMDVIEIGNEKYRVLICKSGFYFAGLDAESAKRKLLRISGKSNIRKGKFQIHFHDGRNMLADSSEHKSGDVVLWNLAERKIEDTFPLEKGAEVLVIEGKNRGMTGKIAGVRRKKSMLQKSIAVVKSGDETKEVPLAYVFVIGREKAIPELGDMNAAGS